jgi:hypothetical protein
MRKRAVGAAVSAAMLAAVAAAIAPGAEPAAAGNTTVEATTRTSSTVGAAEEPLLPAPSPPDPQSVHSRAAGTWGACGSWWANTATEMTSGSVCGIDGLVAENSVVAQLVEPIITVSKYVCFKRKRGGCASQSFQGTVRRSEMTVDPLLRRATIRGTLGGCVLDLEFAGIAPARPGGNLAEYHGVGGGPQITVSGAETFTSDARWWGGVCGQTVVVDGDTGQASLFRGVEANISGFGGQSGCECGE